MRATVLIMLLFFVASCLATYEDGLDAYRLGDYERAYSKWLGVAISPPEAVPPGVMEETCYALGMLFWLGQGVTQDTVASAQWLTRAAEMGHPGAQTKLGFLYGSGQGVQQSDYEAFKWTRMAANQGDSDAQYNLGVFYRDGKGVAPDADQALKWFREAASNGDQVSADVLANYEKYGWVSEAEDQPVPEAENSVPSLTWHDEEWIRQRDPQHYTIQVIAVRSPENMEAFIQNNVDWEPFAVYQLSSKGKPLFVLVQGDYADLEQARIAMAGFPAGLQNQSELWIRKFEMVQALLSRN